MDPHAQFEIRSYANVIGNEIVSRWCPVAWQAFQDYRMNGMEMSSLDVEMIKLIVAGKDEDAFIQNFSSYLDKIIPYKTRKS